jgi:hypothetical protein
MSANPYASPQARLEPGFGRAAETATQGCWRIGKDVLFVQRYSDLPPRCVKCNGPAARPPKRRSFYWHSSAWYLLILISIWIYAIAAMIVRKKAEASPALCASHASQRSKRVWGAFGAVIGGCVAAWAAMSYDQPWIAFACFLGGLVASIVIAMLARIMYPVEIDDRGARFKGCGPAFLDSLESNRPW